MTSTLVTLIRSYTTLDESTVASSEIPKQLAAGNLLILISYDLSREILI